LFHSLLKSTMVALAFISSFLRLQTVAAADQHHPIIFGRKISSFGRSMHERGTTSTIPPLKRIRNALVEDESVTFKSSSSIIDVQENQPISSEEIATFQYDETTPTILIEQSMSIIISSSFMSFDILTSIEEMSMVSIYMSMPDSSILDPASSDPASSVVDTVNVTSDDDHYFGETIVRRLYFFELVYSIKHSLFYQRPSLLILTSTSVLFVFLYKVPIPRSMC
jgi:hypothetical protein